MERYALQTQTNSAPARRPTLATLFSRDVPYDDASTLALWERHFDGDIDADHRLFEHYAPLVRVIAFQLKNRRAEYFIGDINEMMSDGSLGLLNAIRLARGGHFTVRFLISREITKAMYRELQTRRWGGRRRQEYIAVTRRVHSELTGELGRLPTPQEMLGRLSGLIHNPNLFIHGVTEMHAASDRPRRDRSAKPGYADEPFRRLVDADAIRLSGKALDKNERKMLKLLLAGHTPKEIAARLNLTYSSCYQRLNGVLWKCRCHAELAAYLGVEPAATPERNAGRHLPSFPFFAALCG